MAKTQKPRAKTRLLQAGIKEFAAHGYRGASLREPPQDCRRPVSSNYAAMGVSSSMA
jgi:hypothetical protein